MKRVRAILFAAIGAVALASIAPARAQESIAIGEQSWAGARATGYVLKAVIEKRIGAKAHLRKADAAAMFAAMDLGDGSVDVVPDTWMPNHYTFVTKYVDEKRTVRAGRNPYKGTANICVPKYLSEKLKIRSIDDLKRPEVVKVFAHANGGKASFWPGATGWGSANIWLVKFKSYGLNDWEALRVDEQVFRAKLDADYKKREPVLFYCYEPDFMFLAYDLVKLEEPPFTGYSADTDKSSPLYKADGCFKMYQPKDRPDWLEASRVTCATPANDVFVSYSASLEKRNPRVAKFLSQVSFEAKDVAGWIAAISRDKKDPQDVAEEWVAANKAKVDAWLKGI